MPAGNPAGFTPTPIRAGVFKAAGVTEIQGALAVADTSRFLPVAATETGCVPGTAPPIRKANDSAAEDTRNCGGSWTVRITRTVTSSAEDADSVTASL